MVIVHKNLYYTTCLLDSVENKFDKAFEHYGIKTIDKIVYWLYEGSLYFISFSTIQNGKKQIYIIDSNYYTHLCFTIMEIFTHNFHTIFRSEDRISETFERVKINEFLFEHFFKNYLRKYYNKNTKESTQKQFAIISDVV